MALLILAWCLSWKQFEANNEVAPVYSLNAEFSQPLWVFGTNSYEFLKSSVGRNTIVCSYRWLKKFLFCILYLLLDFCGYSTAFPAMAHADREGDHILEFWMRRKAHYPCLISHSRILIILWDIFIFSFVNDVFSQWYSLAFIYTSLSFQTLGSHCLYVVGSSGLHPSSIAKVLFLLSYAVFYFLCTAFCLLTLPKVCKAPGQKLWMTYFLLAPLSSSTITLSLCRWPWMRKPWKQQVSLLSGLLRQIFWNISRTSAFQSLLNFQLKFLAKMLTPTFIHRPILFTRLIRLKSLHYYWKAMVCCNYPVINLSYLSNNTNNYPAMFRFFRVSE